MENKFIIWILVCLSYFAMGQTDSISTKNIKKMKQEIKIKIWSDVVCPYCYLGKSQLEKAIEKLDSNIKVNIEWKSFILDPSLDNKAYEYIPYLENKLGISAQQLSQNFDRLNAAGKEVGIHYNFNQAIITSSTKAHSLLQYAKIDHQQNELEDLLFKAHFVEGKNISADSVLIEIGQSFGWSKTIVEETVNNVDYKSAIQADIIEGNRLGVRGVPFFVFNNQYAVSGAQGEQQFVKLLKQIVQDISVDQSKDASSCDIDKGCK